LLPFCLIGVGSTADVVDHLVSFGEVAFWVFWLLLMINLFGHLEDLICKTLRSVVVPGLVLPLGVEDADLVQETFELSRPGSVLFVMMRLLHVCHGAIQFPLLVVIL
jgi:hypothetical protein